MTPQVSILATGPTTRRKLGRGYADKRSRPGRLGMTACADRVQLVLFLHFNFINSDF